MKCSNSDDQIVEGEIQFTDPIAIESIDNLRRGDILVQPNLDWLTGSSLVNEGIFFGHAVMVINDAESQDLKELLSSVEVFESVARNLPMEAQNRIVKAYDTSADLQKQNLVFANKGSRFRLRPNITDEDINRVIEYVIRQEDGHHSWRAYKKYDRDERRKKEYWYCSLIIWQAFYDVLGIDLDSNQGFIVYPNDLINHPLFDGEVDGEKSRIRF